jgi:hypothetical protein
VTTDGITTQSLTLPDTTIHAGEWQVWSVTDAAGKVTPVRYVVQIQ